MKVYIAGKVTGLNLADAFVKFGTAEFQLKQAGYDVVNPMRICSQSWSWEKCMKACIMGLVQCDAIYLLPDWKESEGARLEYYIAKKLKLKIITL
ncbi:MAG: DUF4406 domain-containing protein [Bacteroidetes bacterium]|nr:DUF4406 domain-containing protein [Bacteroidota bacterium]MCL2302928.1 DUF4406 domain-containing protein [Lentimicrobiaceae bacterium]